MPPSELLPLEQPARQNPIKAVAAQVRESIRIIVRLPKN
jgi:hypothetical protein